MFKASDARANYYNDVKPYTHPGRRNGGGDGGKNNNNLYFEDLVPLAASLAHHRN